MKLFRTIFLVASLVATSLALAEKRSGDPVLNAMRQELDRSFQNLKKGPSQPYFISYQLTDNRQIAISGSFGALNSSDDRRTRILDIDMRVGDYTLDNTHPIRDGFSFMGPGRHFGAASMPIENDPDALRMVLWHETEERYCARNFFDERRCAALTTALWFAEWVEEGCSQ